MVSTYTTFDELLRRLGLLSSRRQLYDEELFQTATLLGQLVAHCCEEPADDAAGSRSGRYIYIRT